MHRHRLRFRNFDHTTELTRNRINGRDSSVRDRHTPELPLQTVAALTEKRRKERTTSVNPSNILLVINVNDWEGEEKGAVGNCRSSFSCASMAAGAYAITGASSAFLIYTRSVCAAYFCGAALCCALSVKVIKKFVKQPRPAGATKLKSYGYELHHNLTPRPFSQCQSKIPYFIGPGSMPSTHSTVVFFYAGTVVLASTTLPIHSSLPDHPYIRAWPPVAAGTSAAMVALSRVWRGHHNFLQIAAGSLYGTACSVVAFKLWISGLDIYGHRLEQWVDAFMGWR